MDIGAIERRFELLVGSLQDSDGAHKLLAEIRLLQFYAGRSAPSAARRGGTGMEFCNVP